MGKLSERSIVRRRLYERGRDGDRKRLSKAEAEKNLVEERGSRTPPTEHMHMIASWRKKSHHVLVPPVIITSRNHGIFYC